METLAIDRKGIIFILTKNGDWLLALFVLGLVMVMIIPIPPFMMDILLSFSITFSILIILIAMYVLKPLEFSVYPSILLVATMTRLSINVASTRLILLNGHKGTDAAGKVIKAFGNFVVGGNYVVGIIVFIILIVINFIVITKGAGRIAEVAARFTLDAMPGKQMSIDADLNAGLIDEKEARKRRELIAREAEFYGAMDGASKFVRGDAIAGIIITMINIVGGLLIGVLQHGMSLKTAAQNYTILTVGDGLVSQIPALIVSTSAGIIVTRAASESNLGNEVSQQILFYPKAIAISAGIIFLFGLVPGLPHIPFILFSMLTGLLAWGSYKIEQTSTEEEPEIKEEEREPEEKQEDMTGIPPLDVLEINLGYSLISLVDPEQNGDLVDRIKSVRQQFAREMGIIIPPVHIRDSLQLSPNQYSIIIKGNEIARGELMPDRLLVLNPTGSEIKGLQGIPTREPSFGLPGMWINPSEKEKAEVAGYTVVTPTTVIATHLTEVIKNHCHELIGRQEVQNMLEGFSKKYPKVVEELVPSLLPLGVVVKVLQNLLKERIPVRDMLTILETLADYAPVTKDPDILTEHVRANLARTITRQYEVDGVLHVITLEPSLEEKISGSVKQTSQGLYLVLDPWIAQSLVRSIREALERALNRGISPVILTSPGIRLPLRRFLERYIPHVVVLSSNEISSTVTIQTIDTVRCNDAG